MIDLSKVISYDIETTGLSPKDDDIIQLAIVDGYGNELFNHYFKPKHKINVEAESVNHLDFDKLQQKQPFVNYMNEVQTIFCKADLLLGYNQLDFDNCFLQYNGIDLVYKPSIDVKQMVAEEWKADNVKQKWHHSPYHRFHLSEAASMTGYDWGKGQAHDALADAKATAYVYRKLANQNAETDKVYLNMDK